MNEKEPFSILVIIFIISLFICYHLYYFVEKKVNKSNVENYVEKIELDNNTTNVVEKVNNEEVSENYIGVLSIPKININRGFYPINSLNNDVNKNIQILKNSDMPDVDYGVMMIAAHSGSSYISFFKDLNKLSLDDEVYIYYNNIKYTYYVQKIYEQERDGTISFDKNIHETILVLTTCGSEGKQLIVIAKRKVDLINE